MKGSHIALVVTFSVFLAKKKESYRSLLDEYKELPLDATFKDIKKKIVDDPRYNKFSSSDKKCEKEFNSWVSSKTFRANIHFNPNIYISRFVIEFKPQGMNTNSF